ncbi:MAG: BlaI/MecI/CopY family transcriptional regulator [Actinomycetales bacterium]|nr:BlaI/MecI/CopY family transcriptional regulator [Actinomycetales bacterium]
MTSRGRNQGELESAVLEVLWSARDSDGPQLTSQEISERLTPTGMLAITTVLTVLSRLVDKGLVSRSQGAGRSLLFEAAQSRAQHDAALLLRIVEDNPNPLLAFSHFTSGLTPEQLAALKQSLNRD